MLHHRYFCLNAIAMILVVAATAFELKAFTKAVQAGPSLSVQQLVCGIGPVEAALQLSVFLSQAHPLPTAVLNIGIAGAYHRQGQAAALLDICLAEYEELGDLGTCQTKRITPLQVPQCKIPDSFALDAPLLLRMQRRLDNAGIAHMSGRFITVGCVSGDRARGELLLDRYPDALCENMEGAALARVCAYFALPFAEMRCISNLVDDPANQDWRLQEACTRCGRIAALLFQESSNHD